MNETRIRPSNFYTTADQFSANLSNNLARSERDILTDRTFLDQNFLDEVRAELTASNKQPDPNRKYPGGKDWIFKIPLNKDGTQDVCQDVTFTGYWSLSSCKAGIGCSSSTDGYGINELLSDSVDKYWQSDGPQPHHITAEFNTKTDISFIMLYLDYKNDESYTPQKVSVHLGGCLERMEDGKEFEFNEPIGWQALDMRKPNGKASRAFVLQLQVLGNHQNGRDTHIRHIRIISPAVRSYDAIRRYQTTPGGDPRTYLYRPSYRNYFQDVIATGYNSKLMNSLTIR